VRELDASTIQLEWIVDAYNLMFAALVLAAGNLGDRVGRKGVLLAGLAVFGAATLAGGLGENPGQLIAARAAMGIGAALIFPATLSLLTNVFTERRERARAIGLWGATTGVRIALGPIVGGWLLERFDWSSVFFALAPVAALAVLLVAVSVPTSRDPEAPPADRVGLVLSTAAIAALVYTIIEAPREGWDPPRSIRLRFGRRAPRGLHRLGAPGSRPDARRRPLSQPSLQRRQRGGDDHLLLADGLHLPRHPLLSVPQGIFTAQHRGAAAAGGHIDRDHVGPRHQHGRAHRYQTGCRRRPAGARRRPRLDLDGLREHDLPDDRRPDGADRLRDRPDGRAGAGVDHGRGPPGQGRRRLGGQRRHPHPRRNPRSRRDRQHYVSLYSSRLTAALPAQLSEGVADTAERSVGTAFGVAGQLREGGQTGLSEGGRSKERRMLVFLAT
jgi:Major Facilitator Superfamily